MSSLNTRKLIAALSGAIEARKAAIEVTSPETEAEYVAFLDEVEEELKEFIRAARAE